MPPLFQKYGTASIQETVEWSRTGQPGK